MPRSLAAVPAFAVALLAGGAWYLAGERFAVRLGATEIAPAVGLLLGALTVLTLWRRNAADQLETSLRRWPAPPVAPVWPPSTSTRVAHTRRG